ncbi:hypothetical protein Leryth_025751, partial [Lithospermum erythrorhizon]
NKTKKRLTCLPPKSYPKQHTPSTPAAILQVHHQLKYLLIRPPQLITKQLQIGSHSSPLIRLFPPTSIITQQPHQLQVSPAHSNNQPQITSSSTFLSSAIRSSGQS